MDNMRKSLWARFAAGALALTCTSGVFAMDSSQSSLSALVRTSIDKTDNLPAFRAVVDRPELFPGFHQYFCQQIANGKTYTKIYFANDKGEIKPNSTMSVTNDKGSWAIVNTTAIQKKYEYHDAAATDFFKMLDSSPGNKFEQEEITVGEDKCLRITETFTDAYTAELKRKWEAARGLVPFLSSREMTLTGFQYVVRKSDDVLIKRKLLETGGRIVFESGYKDIDINPNFPAGFFEIPADMTVKVANNVDELLALSRMALSGSKP